MTSFMKLEGSFGGGEGVALGTVSRGSAGY